MWFYHEMFIGIKSQNHSGRAAPHFQTADSFYNFTHSLIYYANLLDMKRGNLWCLFIRLKSHFLINREYLSIQLGMK